MVHDPAIAPVTSNLSTGPGHWEGLCHYSEMRKQAGWAATATPVASGGQRWDEASAAPAPCSINGMEQ